ncbi:MAG: iron hydrogenase [Candidatus Falkowbacteria bacterium]
MPYIKEQAAIKLNIRETAWFLAMFGVASMLPFFVHLQWITGPIVNAVLIIVLFIVGVRSALVLCLVPSLLALSGGLLPAVLSPAVPFIMISNVIFILSVEWWYMILKDDKRGYWLGVFVGAGLKTLFLFGGVNMIGGLFLRQELAVKAAQMMSWPQLFTAITGGMIAWVLLKWLKRL